jgi:hypothetical protein
MDTSASESYALMGYPLDNTNFAVYTDRMFVDNPGVYAVIESRKLAAWLTKRKCPECAYQVILMRAFNCNHVKFLPGDVSDLGLSVG